MTKFIIEVSKEAARSLDFDDSVGNPIWIGGWTEDKPEVQSLIRVTRSMIDAAVDQIMDIVEEEMLDGRAFNIREDIRRVIKVMLFQPVPKP